MSMLHGKQLAGTGDAAIANATASIGPMTRIVLTIGPITFLKISRRYFFTTITPTIPAFSCGRQK